MLVAAFISLAMSDVILEVKLPDYSVKHIEKIRVLFAVNEDTKETESFVPMSQYLELLDKVESLSCKKSQNQLSDGTDI